MERSGSLLRRIGRGSAKAVLAAVTAVLALVGATDGGAAVLACLVLVTGAAGLLSYEREARLAATPLPLERRREVATWALAAGVAVAAVAGAFAVGGVACGAVALAAAVVLGVRRWRRATRPGSALAGGAVTGGAVTGGAPVASEVPDGEVSSALPSDALPSDALPSDALPSDALPSDALRHLPSTELVRAWRVSYPLLGRVGHDPDLLGIVSEQRRACLDELARRDPAGFERWIASGARAASDPTRYLDVDQGPEPDGGDPELAW